MVLLEALNFNDNGKGIGEQKGPELIHFHSVSSAVLRFIC